MGGHGIPKRGAEKVQLIFFHARSALLSVSRNAEKQAAKSVQNFVEDGYRRMRGRCVVLMAYRNSGNVVCSGM
jgi:hypothetical protein